MQAAADSLKGTHNFESFQAKGSERVTTERTVTQLDVVHFRESFYDYIDVVISADGFLYNMVRNIVGIGSNRRLTRDSGMDFDGVGQTRSPGGRGNGCLPKVCFLKKLSTISDLS